jgi:Tfp pilus assembly protein FimT
MRKLLFVGALLTPLMAHAAPSSSDWLSANMIRECHGDLECIAMVVRLARSNAVYDALTGACGALPPDHLTAEISACWKRGQAEVDRRERGE